MYCLFRYLYIRHGIDIYTCAHTKRKQHFEDDDDDDDIEAGEQPASKRAHASLVSAHSGRQGKQATRTRNDDDNGLSPPPPHASARDNVDYGVLCIRCDVRCAVVASGATQSAQRTRTVSAQARARAP